MSAPVDPRTTTERPFADELAAARGAALRRLTALTTHDDAKLALRACEVIAKFDGQHRREEVRRETQAARAEARPKPDPRPAPPAEVRTPATAAKAPTMPKAQPPAKATAVRADGTPLRSWLTPDG